MKNDEDLEAKLLLPANDSPSPGATNKADGAAGNAYALVCALLASLASIIYGYSKISFDPSPLFVILV
jgi:hypothetical protein